MKSLFKRAIFYTAYASLAWSITLFYGLNALSSAAVRLTIGLAVLCIVGAVSTFVASFFCRKRGLLGLPEYFFGMIGRTGVPCCFVLLCLLTLSEHDLRPAIYQIMAGYFLTAPVHVWLTTPSESDFQKRYFENKESLGS